MHPTFLPDNERRLLRREYVTRLVIVICLALSFSGLVGLAGLFPAFVQALSEKKSILNSIASLDEDGESSKMVKELSADSHLLAFLNLSADEAILSKIIQETVNVRGPIKITSLTIERRSTTTAAIILRGVSPTRQNLLSFKSRLEDLAQGSIVILPLSELVSSTDIRFSLELNRSLPQTI